MNRYWSHSHYEFCCHCDDLEADQGLRINDDYFIKIADDEKQYIHNCLLDTKDGMPYHSSRIIERYDEGFTTKLVDIEVKVEYIITE